MADMADTRAQRDATPRNALLRSILDDHVLLSAFVVCVLLIAYQLSVTLLQPLWIKPGTDWLRAALAWPQLFVMAWVAVQLLRTHRSAWAICWGTLGLLSYAVARTLWTIDDEVIYPHGVPFPSLPDLFFILQYPCFFLGCILLPERDDWLPGARTMLDGLLWMSAITALLWYFVMLPLVRQAGEPALSKDISLFYQIGDLILLYALVVSLSQLYRTSREQLTMTVLCLAVASLFVGDTWAALQLFFPPHTYRTGSWPDLFRFVCYMLFPLSALVYLRLVAAEVPPRSQGRAERLTWRDMLAGISFVSPSLAGVGASVVIIVHATVTSQSKHDLMLPEAVSILLLVLAALRPAAMYLEQEQLRRERDTARTQEGALRLANERMEAFLTMVAHELKTPLTSLVGNSQLMARRLDTLLRLVRNHEEYSGAANALRTLIEWSDQGLGRMRRLVEDVLDETRVRQGRLAMRLEPRDLVSVVDEAVTEQVALNPERTIRLVAEVAPVPVLADASRIQQVVANLVGNALKFSRTDQKVVVRVQTRDSEALVTVHDDGVGIPLAEQPRIWELFYQEEGATVQSGSQVGFGIGLYVSKAIVQGHHGHVGVESVPGQGTTIWFTLPVASSRASPLAASSPKEEAHRPGTVSLPAPNDHTVTRDGQIA